uniref:Protein kinase domain-containing protein n=1 Tax=Macrostomum lignano TaxID=282301 RepID=A0A1I8HY06_9PLAT
IRLKEVFETPNHFFMVLELVTGGELFDRIVSRGSYNEKDASQCIGQLLDGLRYLHERGIIHRDLKPENLLYEDEREEAKLKIADFGLSKIADSDVHTRSVCGTPGYCAPEVLLRRGCGTAMDMWSVGRHVPSNPACPVHIRPALWSGISKNARDLIERLLVLDADARLTAGQALRHPWVGGLAAREDSLAEAQNKLREFNARRRLRAATDALLATRHFILAGLQRSQATQHQQEQQKPQSTAGAEMSSAAAEPAFTSIY